MFCLAEAIKYIYCAHIYDIYIILLTAQRLHTLFIFVMAKMIHILASGKFMDVINNVVIFE